MNTFGRHLRVTSAGESHGPAMGVIVDGAPPGLALSASDVQRELDRRRPGAAPWTSARREPDRVEVLSGLLEGATTGMPIMMLVRNVDARDEEYSEGPVRPSHGDLVFLQRYGVSARGGGRYSGRETVARVCAGAVARSVLAPLGCAVRSHVASIGSVSEPLDVGALDRLTPFGTHTRRASRAMKAEVLAAMDEGDSVGGVVEVVATGVPAGLGSPVFGRLDSDIASALMSIGGVKGVELGAGFGAARMRGSAHNDPYRLEGGRAVPATNNAGGVLAGISTGAPVVARLAVKPTATIAKPQRTVDLSTGRERTVAFGGRHDPCIVPRLRPVAEAMLALVLADHALDPVWLFGRERPFAPRRAPGRRAAGRAR
jgi:chorismate synthase